MPVLVPGQPRDKHKPYTPDCGLLYTADRQPYMAESAPHLLASAPTRTG